MAKCLNCGRIIENEEIQYRPGTKGGYQNRSIKLCVRCVDQHDQIQSAKKLMTRVVSVVAVVALVAAAIYLLIPR
jgi:putative lipoic acid-binding regulatory protein